MSILAAIFALFGGVALVGASGGSSGGARQTIINPVDDTDDKTTNHTDDTDHTDTDTDTDHTDDTVHTDHTDDTTATITPPPVGASQEEIDAYVAAVKEQPEIHMHDADSDKLTEHMATMSLTPRDEATHIAVSDGDWFDPDTWYNGEIPDDDARVLIPEGIEVTFDEVSEARLFTVRIDGELNFDTQADAQMIFDTMIVSASGRLEIGTIDDPVSDDVSIDLIVANNGPIDVTWDPQLLSRGIISHGETSIHGAAKDSHEKVDEDPMMGDTSLSFDELPEGWAVGDTLVIAGTRYDGYKWDGDAAASIHHPSEDEVCVITGIDGGTVYLDRALEFDHDTPRDDLKTSVANYSRNVSVETEDAHLAEVSERGHVMFMHSDDVDVRYAEFHELGRTDKSELSKQASDFDDIASDSNVQGRYSLHLHRTGTDDLDNPSVLEGNAVWGSPGWGFVHHDSNAVLSNNASYDTFGAGYVAETGNETGAWTDNIAIYAKGISWGESKNTSVLNDDTFDTARGGDGFWFQGRLVEASDNVAASVNHGFAYLHRDGDDRVIDVSADQFDYPDAFYGRDIIGISRPPILNFTNNETFAARQGLEVVKAGIPQQHDIWTHIKDFTAWSVQDGIFLEYTNHYLLSGIDVTGKDPVQFSLPQEGIDLGKGTGDIVIVDTTIDGFTNGIALDNEQPVGDRTPLEQTNYTIVDTEITGAETDIVNYNPVFNTVTTRDELDAQDPNLELDPLIFENNIVDITGTKHDSLGETEFPSGVDFIQLNYKDVQRILEEDGYWSTSEGYDYFLLDVYFSDRLTGDVMYETHTVELTEQTTRGFGQWWSDYENVELNGVQDIVTENGVTRAGDVVLDKAFAAIPQSIQEKHPDVPDMDHAAGSGDPEIAPEADAVFNIFVENDEFESDADALWQALTQGYDKTNEADLEPDEEPEVLELLI